MNGGRRKRGTLEGHGKAKATIAGTMRWTRVKKALAVASKKNGVRDGKKLKVEMNWTEAKKEAQIVPENDVEVGRRDTPGGHERAEMMREAVTTWIQVFIVLETAVTV